MKLYVYIKGNKGNKGSNDVTFTNIFALANIVCKFYCDFFNNIHIFISILYVSVLTKTEIPINNKNLEVTFLMKSPYESHPIPVLPTKVLCKNIPKNPYLYVIICEWLWVIPAGSKIQQKYLLWWRTNDQSHAYCFNLEKWKGLTTNRHAIRKLWKKCGNKNKWEDLLKFLKKGKNTLKKQYF